MSGIFGVVTPKENCIKDLFYGTDYHSHMGTEFAGIAVYSDKIQRSIHNINQSQFKSKFFDEYRHIKATKGIGVISAFDEQPIYINSRFGKFCIITNGLIDNAEELMENLMKKGITFTEVTNGKINATEVIAKLISQGKNVVDGIEKMFRVIKGSCSLLILNKDGIYAARDRMGFTPLIIGQRENSYAVTSESCAYPNTDYNVIKNLGPGEIILIDEKGIHQKKQPGSTEKICAFLWIYTGYPASSYNGINVESVREKCGKCLAKKDKDIEVDLVSGVPDSGTAHALGYAMESGKPFRRPLVKYTPGYGRSYTPPSQETRDLIARMKLIAIKEIIKGNRIIVCDDSIVRGTQLKNFTINKLIDAGAKEIHIRPACPPLLFPCKFCMSTRSINELAARKAIRSLEGQDIENIDEYIDEKTEKHNKMVEWIRKDLGATTLRYQSIDDMIGAIGMPKEKICQYCWTGK